MKVNFKKYLDIFSVLTEIKFNFKNKTRSFILFKILKDLYQSNHGFFFYKKGAFLVILYKPEEDLLEVLWAKNLNQILIKDKVYMRAFFKYAQTYGKYSKYISWKRGKTNKIYRSDIGKFLTLLNKSTELKYKTTYL